MFNLQRPYLAREDAEEEESDAVDDPVRVEEILFQADRSKKQPSDPTTESPARGGGVARSAENQVQVESTV